MFFSAHFTFFRLTLITRAVMTDITIVFTIISFFIFIASIPLPYYNKLRIQKNLTSLKEIRFHLSKSLGSFLANQITSCSDLHYRG